MSAPYWTAVQDRYIDYVFTVRAAWMMTASSKKSSTPQSWPGWYMQAQPGQSISMHLWASISPFNTVAQIVIYDNLIIAILFHYSFQRHILNQPLFVRKLLLTVFLYCVQCGMSLFIKWRLWWSILEVDGKEKRWRVVHCRATESETQHVY